MGSLQKTFVTFALAGLFVLALFSFVYTTQSNNELDETILDNSILNKTVFNLSENFGGYDKIASNQSSSQDSDNPKTEGGSLLFLSITGTGKVIKSMTLGVYNVLIVIPSQLLGFPEVVIIFITGLIGVLLVLGAWRLYKAGE